MAERYISGAAKYLKMQKNLTVFEETEVISIHND
jgi:hypothetical protein